MVTLLLLQNDELTDECKSSLTGPISVSVIDSCSLKSFKAAGPDEHLEYPHLDPTAASLENLLLGFPTGIVNSEDGQTDSVDPSNHTVLRAADGDETQAIPATFS